MKRRILLVDDEVAVLLTLKAILEISGFDVDTATSGREGRARIRTREYEMVITDMRMEEEHAGKDVIEAAKAAPYNPAIALLTAFPMGDAEWAETGADKMLIKPMHTRVLLQQLEALFVRHHGPAALVKPAGAAVTSMAASAGAVKKIAVKKTAPKRAATVKKAAGAKKAAAKTIARKVVAKKIVSRKAAAPVKKGVAKNAIAKKTAKR